MRVIEFRSAVAFGEHFLSIQFNVFLGRADGFCGVHHVAIFASLHAHRAAITEAVTGMLHLYYSMYHCSPSRCWWALTTTIMGIIWVRWKAATLTTVFAGQPVSDPASLEAHGNISFCAAWYLGWHCSATILLYSCRERVLGEGAMRCCDASEPGQRRSRTHRAEIGVRVPAGRYAPRSVWCRCTAGCPDAHAEGPTPVSAVLSGLLLNVALIAVMRTRCWWTSAGQHTLRAI